MKNINYYVIGGQYAYYNYGGAKTLEGAKRLATSKIEYWDNHNGFKKPVIYRKEDCEEGTNFYGTNQYPIYGTVPVAVWDERSKKWTGHESN